MARDKREDIDDQESEGDYEEYEEGGEEVDDESFDDAEIELGDDEMMDEGDFDGDDDEDAAATRATAAAAKRRVATRPPPSIEGVPKARLDKPDAIRLVWEKLSDKQKGSKGTPYNIRSTYRVGEAIEHKSFGLGFVVEVQSATKVEVIFQDALRKLVQGR